MTALTVAAVAANFGRDMEDAFARIEVLLDRARERGARLVVLPEATLGGYLTTLHTGARSTLPPALDVDGPEVNHRRPDVYQDGLSAAQVGAR